jgi:adenosylcobinamide-phosphate synthase
MAAGAGALNIELGGCATYHGKLRNKPILGVGRIATPSDILAALNLLRQATFLWVVLLGALALGTL